ncbi:hypothetical protein ACFFTN_26860 [Aminobacter aganoensis]|uniref:Uncharacterized protein n=1 Tax=Aminobacter aganoensis TaxID=83264 RepID=A0A7X0FE98_9HYPH|nr:MULTISPECIES: hypothetical protein [Aminobacter]KQU72889.1 hypothetical protein ASC75_04225 [Aminobacter sp. DSM 101952]MBB6357833.1 hypothetical protein [Aminobacter aganoensis]
MSRKRKQEIELIDPPLPGYGHFPFLMHNTLVLAVSIAATMEGAHHKCTRRECRNFGRCRASPTDLRRAAFCPVPLSREADRRIEGMFLFLLRLAHGWR